MVGYKLFLEELKKLDVSFQNKVIGNIFDKVVLVFDISINYHGNIYIRFYDGKVYYQYCFIFENRNNCLEIKLDNRIVCYNIYILNSDVNVMVSKKIYRFVKILKTGDISLFKSFL